MNDDDTQQCRFCGHYTKAEYRKKRGYILEFENPKLCSECSGFILKEFTDAQMQTLRAFIQLDREFPPGVVKAGMKSYMDMLRESDKQIRRKMMENKL